MCAMSTVLRFHKQCCTLYCCFRVVCEGNNDMLFPFVPDSRAWQQLICVTNDMQSGMLAQWHIFKSNNKQFKARYWIIKGRPSPCVLQKVINIFIRNPRSRKNIHTMMAFWYKQIESKKKVFFFFWIIVTDPPPLLPLPRAVKYPFLPSSLCFPFAVSSGKKSFGRQRRKGGNRKLSDPPLLLLLFPAKLQPKKETYEK